MPGGSTGAVGADSGAALLCRPPSVLGGVVAEIHRGEVDGDARGGDTARKMRMGDEEMAATVCLARAVKRKLDLCHYQTMVSLECHYENTLRNYAIFKHWITDKMPFRGLFDKVSTNWTILPLN